MKRYIDYNDDGSWSIMEGIGVSAEIGRFSIGQKVIIKDNDGCCDAVIVDCILIYRHSVEIEGTPLDRDGHYGYGQDIDNIKSITAIQEIDP